LSKDEIHRCRENRFENQLFAIEWTTRFDLFPTFQIDLGKYFEGEAVERDMD
jgi:hypothetical protein